MKKIIISVFIFAFSLASAMAMSLDDYLSSDIDTLIIDRLNSYDPSLVKEIDEKVINQIFKIIVDKYPSKTSQIIIYKDIITRINDITIFRWYDSPEQIAFNIFAYISYRIEDKIEKLESSIINPREYKIINPKTSPYSTNDDIVVIEWTIPEWKIQKVVVNDYELQKFVPYSTSWKYFANANYDNLNDWENIYEIEFYWEDWSVIYTDEIIIIRWEVEESSSDSLTDDTWDIDSSTRETKSENNTTTIIKEETIVDKSNYKISYTTEEKTIDILASGEYNPQSGTISWLTKDTQIIMIRTDIIKPFDKLTLSYKNEDNSKNKELIFTWEKLLEKLWDFPFQNYFSITFDKENWLLDDGLNEYTYETINGEIKSIARVELYLWTEMITTEKTVVSVEKIEIEENDFSENKELSIDFSLDDLDILSSYGETKIIWNNTIIFTDVKNVKLIYDKNIKNVSCDSTLDDYLYDPYAYNYRNTCYPLGDWLIVFNLMHLGKDGANYTRHYLDMNNLFHGIYEIETDIEWITWDNILEKNLEYKTKEFDWVEDMDNFFKELFDK